MAIEEPKFTRIEKDGAFEIRAYAPKMIAEVNVTGNLKNSSNKGFRSIADFIFGNNTASSGGAEKISMTAPVVMKANPSTLGKTNNEWVMYFVMPNQYTKSTIPQPKNPNVILRTVGEKKVAVLGFSGLVNEEKIALKATELNQWIANKKDESTKRPRACKIQPSMDLAIFKTK